MNAEKLFDGCPLSMLNQRRLGLLANCLHLHPAKTLPSPLPTLLHVQFPLARLEKHRPCGSSRLIVYRKIRPTQRLMVRRWSWLTSSPKLQSILLSPNCHSESLMIQLSIESAGHAFRQKSSNNQSLDQSAVGPCILKQSWITALGQLGRYRDQFSRSHSSVITHGRFAVPLRLESWISSNDLRSWGF